MSILYVVVVAARNVQEFGRIWPQNSNHLDWYESIPSLFQCIALLPALWQCAKVEPPESLRRNHALATKACNQFGKCLTALIATWIVFYFLIFLGRFLAFVGYGDWIPRLAPW